MFPFGSKVRLKALYIRRSHWADECRCLVYGELPASNIAVRAEGEEKKKTFILDVLVLHVMWLFELIHV